MTNSLTYASETFYTDLGLTSDFQIFLNNENSHGQNSTTFRHKPFHELVTSYMYNINLPLVNSGENFSNYLTPKIALKFSPHKTKDISNDLRRLSVDNLFSFDRIGYANNVEEGGSLTAGLNYYLENDNFDRLLNFEIGASWKDVRNSHLPKNSTLGLKTSDIVGRIGYDPPSFNKTDTTFEFDYDFLLDNDVTTLNYNQFTTRISINQLVTEFKFVKEDNYVGAASYWSNKARFQFDDNNSLIYSTRRDRERALTEFYDLIYEYKNDCLSAEVRYHKTYYEDLDLQPEETLFFSLTIVPLTKYDTGNLLPKSRSNKK